MRENRLSGSEGGATLVQSSLPLSIILSLRDITRLYQYPSDPLVKGNFSIPEQPQLSHLGERRVPV
jgi:hypothetical protein